MYRYLCLRPKTVLFCLPMEKLVYFTSLGCSKNLVDSQVMLGYMGLGGYQVTDEPQNADAIIVNTCSFIEASKKESIDTILELADYKIDKNGKCRALAVSGCLPQRYTKELEEGLPEVDLFIGTGEYHKIAKLISAHEQGQLEKKSFVEVPKFIHTEFDPRVNTTPFYTSWLKVSEGCNRNCTFCIIPTIRGSLRSRSVDSLVKEAQQLAQTGVKELNLISQDLSDYGSDIKGDDLYKLLCELEKIEGVEWIRLFYMYPDDLTDEVIEKMAESSKICSYLDMPIQHFSDSVLKRMNRKITGEQILKKISKLRSLIPDLVLRTSIIVGFPGETEEDFNALLHGMKTVEFDHVGIFRYSDEDGTPAFKLKPKVDQDIIEERFDRLYEVQKEIAEKRNHSYIGKTIEVLIEGHHEETDLLIKARHAGQAPDVDGIVIINDTSDVPLSVGQIRKALVTEVEGFDLVAKIVS